MSDDWRDCGTYRELDVAHAVSAPWAEVAVDAHYLTRVDRLSFFQRPDALRKYGDAPGVHSPSEYLAHVVRHGGGWGYYMTLGRRGESQVVGCASATFAGARYIDLREDGKAPESAKQAMQMANPFLFWDLANILQAGAK